MTSLEIRNLLPEYFTEERKNTSEVWGKDIAINKGELVKIVAPSGSGKTSLMHFLYGLRHQYSGDISYDGKKTRGFTAEDTAQTRSNHISIVLQDLRLFPGETVYDNINIKRHLNPYHEAPKIRDMADRLVIGSKLDSKIKICSYGEQQRVAIIRSLMQPFSFLLLDEPFSHLDNRNSELAMDLMLEEAKVRNAAIIFADLERIDYFPYTRIFHL